MLKRMGCAQGRKNARSKYTKYTELQNTDLKRIWFWIGLSK